MFDVMRIFVNGNIICAVINISIVIFSVTTTICTDEMSMKMTMTMTTKIAIMAQDEDRQRNCDDDDDGGMNTLMLIFQNIYSDGFDPLLENIYLRFIINISRIGVGR